MHGFIYKLRSPSGKEYIGQTIEFRRNGERRGIRVRWLEHCRSAKRHDTKGCLVLNTAIRKYGPEKFTIIRLMRCKLDVIDLFEQLYIRTHNTMVPNGYNLQSGGTFTKHSEETCKKRSMSLKALLKDPKKRKIWSLAKLGKPQAPTKRKCKNSMNQNLPKYIVYRESHNGKYKGYVVEHPNGNKRFGKQRYTLAENLRKATDYLDQISTQ
jgi:hypothetical protein